MTTKDYIKKYNLDIFNNRFDKSRLLGDLNGDFQALLEKEMKDFELSYDADDNKRWEGPNHSEFTDDKFCKLVVKPIIDKFWAISNKRNGFAFTEKYWGYFYQAYVLPVRNHLFKIGEEKIPVLQEEDFGEIYGEGEMG